MGLDRPNQATGGDYLDLKAETENGPRLIIFKLLEYLPSKPDDFGHRTHPVRAHALICDGPNKGRVYLGGTYKYAITNALRGAGRDEEATHELGKTFPLRCERSKKKGVPTQTVFGNAPSDSEFDAASAVYTAAGGDLVWENAPANEEMASAGTGKKPW